MNQNYEMNTNTDDALNEESGLWICSSSNRIDVFQVYSTMPHLAMVTLLLGVPDCEPKPSIFLTRSIPSRTSPKTTFEVESRMRSAFGDRSTYVFAIEP